MFVHSSTSAHLTTLLRALLGGSASAPALMALRNSELSKLHGSHGTVTISMRTIPRCEKRTMTLREGGVRSALPLERRRINR